ncbi:AI-2E family transporter [Methylobacterium sp. J-070]|uniref:AI-2E family transporter n=1 Tax=Methylobacterium sp. J-070 TaxID=2836650 RepID=UPI001FB963C9|nr:AI-2E family transporter [Methylobacterium sp. J-070]MCJ2049496.1 AI-2E family transporter [Methylobacterium sp. J-070]
MDVLAPMHPTESPLTGDPTRRRRRAGLAAAVLLIALWTARSYLAAVVWAVIIAVAIWPLYSRAQRAGTSRGWLAPALVTLFSAAVLMTPLLLAAAELGREGQAVLGWIDRVQQRGIEMPEWMGRLPILGAHLDRWWRSHVSEPAGLQALFAEMNFESWAAWMRGFGGEIAYRALLAFVTFLTLFALLRDGEKAGTRVLCVSEEWFGNPGERLFERLAFAIRGVVNGTVLVAIGEGLLIGLGYWVAGLPQAGLFTLLTVAFAMLPFGAWIAFTAAALLLVVQREAWFEAASVFGWGAAVMLAGDNFVQPALIGGSARMPLVWTMIGILGGLESFGLVGLFVGPVVMAALYSIWQDWAEPGVSVVDRAGRY